MSDNKKLMRMVRARALERLAVRYPEEFLEIYNAEREKVGLPPRGQSYGNGRLVSAPLAARES